jgi:(4S)-4-hydroxy-5-phosphonooxypentane-2,3-dione isomerase
MVVTIVYVKTKPESAEAFKAECMKNHEASVREPGNRRFDFLAAEGSPCEFVLYEAYDSAEAAAAHKETAHYKAWREAVAPMMAEPRRGVSYAALAPR